MSDFEVDRLRQKISDVGALLTEAAQTGRSLNEADTEHIIIDPFLQTLGYGPLEIKKRKHDGVTRTFPDYTLLDGTPHRWFLEVKELDLPLHDREAMQAVGYAINQGATWAVLTNGRTWYFYLAHLEKPLPEKRVFQIDDVFSDPAHAVNMLALLSRASMTSDGLRRKWNAEQTQALLHTLVRRELTTPLSPTRKFLRKTAAAETGVALSDTDIGDVLQDLFAGIPVAGRPLPAPEAVSPTAQPLAPLPPPVAPPSQPAPPGDWKTLDELRRDSSLTTSRKPVRVLLGDTEVQTVKSWSEVAQRTVQFLGESYGLPPLPFALKGKGKKYYLNVAPLRADGQPMITKALTAVSGQNVYIDMNRSADNTASALFALSNEVNAPLDAVRVEVGP